MKSSYVSHAINVTTTVQIFEKMTTEARQKNQELRDFFPRRSCLRKKDFATKRNKHRNCGSKKYLATTKNKEIGNSYSKLRCDDETEDTMDESTEFSDSFSLSSSSLYSSPSHHAIRQRWLPCDGARNNNDSMTKLLQIVPLELEEDDSSSSESISLTCNQFSTNIDDWDIVKILGEGAFGQVAQVERKNTSDECDGDRRCYALKMLSKYQIVRDGQVDVVITEKKLLRAASDHPFIVKLRAAWQDDNLIYLLQDFVQGGELYSLLLQDGHDASNDDGLPQRKALPVEHAQFYAACIADALNHLHSKCNIVYRDLKPENALIDDRGYPKLIDLGAAKLLTEQDDYQTLTLCGTPRYVAPEQISGSGHSFGVDHWALVVLVYEMLSGVHPFDEWDGTNEFALYGRIVSDSYPALPHFVGENARDWVDQLLVKDPVLRLGGKSRSNIQNDRSDLQLHPWLSSIDVAALRRRAVPAPWVPKLLDLNDSTHFDDWNHLDSVVQTHYPKLTAREAAMFAAFDDDA